MFNNVSLLTWLICLLALSVFWHSFHFMITHFLFFTPTHKIDFIDFYNSDISINFLDISMACLLCWTSLHSYTASCTDQHTHIQYIPPPSPSLSSIKTSYLTQDGRGGQAEPRGHNRGCIWGVRYWEGHLHFSLRIFTDSDTISCSVWRAFDCEPGTGM